MTIVIFVLFLAVVGVGGVVVGRRLTRESAEQHELDLYIRLQRAWIETHIRPANRSTYSSPPRPHLQECYAVTTRWIAVPLPLSRKLTLIRAGVGPEESVNPTCVAMTTSDLQIMAGLVSLYR